MGTGRRGLQGIVGFSGVAPFSQIQDICLSRKLPFHLGKITTLFWEQGGDRQAPIYIYIYIERERDPKIPCKPQRCAVACKGFLDFPACRLVSMIFREPKQTKSIEMVGFGGA